MSTISNLFSNLNDLTKTKSVTDSATIYKKHKYDLYTPTPALNQGDKFKKYQKKIKKDLEKKASELSEKEGFMGLNLLANGLTNQSNNIIQQNDYSSQQQIIANLRKEYQDTLAEYNALLQKTNGTTNDYINRVGSNNPYHGKNVCLSGGACGYVTKQGVFKWYPADNGYTYNNTAGKNGCPNTPYIQIQGDGNISALGSAISSNPPLVVGTPMVAGQSCGNEGSNVFVNTLVNSISTAFTGCFRNTEPVTNIKFSPTLIYENGKYVSGNNGYKPFSSSTYMNDFQQFGCWRAFDNDKNTFWHSSTDSSDLYDAYTGEYKGSVITSYLDKNNSYVRLKGEYLGLIGDNGIKPIKLTKYDLQGRQDCCGNPNGRNPNSWVVIGRSPQDNNFHFLDQQTNVNMDFDMKTFTVNDSSSYTYDSFYIVITNCGNSGDKSGNRYCVQISTWNLYTSNNASNNTSAMTVVSDNTTYEDCKNYALIQGFSYFGIQNADSSGKGKCVVSNDLASTKMYGDALDYVGIALWDTKTYGSNPGSLALINNYGSIVVNNSSGSTVYASDAKNANPGNYIGCYNDCAGGRALPTWLTVGSNAGSTYETCAASASSGNWKYFGLQFTQPNGTSECWVGNDLNGARSQGKAGNCTVIGGNSVGGSCSNAVYSTNSPVSYYYLILQDDGNMCIYRGTGPNDNQGLIWSSDTVGKAQMENPNFSSAKGKYNRNYIVSGETLNQNEFIGSTNGSIYLIMQTDGNLVLYTSNKGSACKALSDGTNVGKNDANAVYESKNKGYKKELGRLAFVDSDTKIHNYSPNDITYSRDYSKISNFNTAYNDLPGAAFGNASVDQCKSACNNNSQCAGFVFDNNSNVCWPKNNSMYPKGEAQLLSGADIYIRSKKPINPPVGISDTTTNVDSNIYHNYINETGNLANKFTLLNMTSVEKQQLEQLQTKLNLLSNNLIKYTDKFGSGTKRADNQTIENVFGMHDYLTNLSKNNNKIKNFDENINNILNDSDIVVLQKNYDYLFWSILAAGTVLVSMNIIKK